MHRTLTLNAAGASAQAVEESLAYAQALLAGATHSLEQIFDARAEIRRRGAAYCPDLFGFSPALIKDVAALDQADAIALITCYGSSQPPKGSGLALS